MKGITSGTSPRAAGQGTQKARSISSSCRRSTQPSRPMRNFVCSSTPHRETTTLRSRLPLRPRASPRAGSRSAIREVSSLGGISHEPNRHYQPVGRDRYSWPLSVNARVPITLTQSVSDDITARGDAITPWDYLEVDNRGNKGATIFYSCNGHTASSVLQSTFTTADGAIATIGAATAQLNFRLPPDSIDRIYGRFSSLSALASGERDDHLPECREILRMRR